MAPHEKTDAPLVCLDSDVVIAGLFSRRGASHALLVLAELGLLRVLLPQAGVEEIERNLNAKLPAALPLFSRFLQAPWVAVGETTSDAEVRAAGRAHEKDAGILASALASGAQFLVTHNVRHYRSGAGVRVVRPAVLLREIRSWMVQFGA